LPKPGVRIVLREAIAIVSVNAGRAESIRHGDKVYESGIRKVPTSGATRVTELGLEGDAVVDTTHHGGVDQAIYVYRTEDYDWWSSESGRDFAPGIFGENLTISGLPANLYVGDRLLIGDVVLEATSARIPCSTLAAAMGDSGFGLAFRHAKRPGVYFRVLNEGAVSSGDTVTMVESENSEVSILDLFHFAYQTSHDADELRRFLQAPIAERVRSKVTRALDALTPG
jgi:MOSC domain-containing protein YiiM